MRTNLFRNDAAFAHVEVVDSDRNNLTEVRHYVSVQRDILAESSARAAYNSVKSFIVVLSTI